MIFGVGTNSASKVPSRVESLPVFSSVGSPCGERRQTLPKAKSLTAAA